MEKLVVFVATLRARVLKAQTEKFIVGIVIIKFGVDTLHNPTTLEFTFFEHRFLPVLVLYSLLSSLTRNIHQS